MTLLGVQANDRVVIPIFSSAELVREWCGVELSTRQVSFDALVASTPKDWWWGLNLGSGVEKEFSPWEIDLLRGGAQNFPAIINEALEDSIAIPVNLGPFEEHENRGLVEALKQLGTSDSRIQRITVAREESITEDDQTVFSILIGVLTKESDHARATEAVRSAAAPALIGAEPLKVFVGNDENAVMLGAFKGLAPLFQRQQPAWWHKIFALCSR